MSENFTWREQLKTNFKINLYVLDFMGKSAGRYALLKCPRFLAMSPLNETAMGSWPFFQVIPNTFQLSAIRTRKKCTFFFSKFQGPENIAVVRSQMFTWYHGIFFLSFI